MRQCLPTVLIPFDVRHQNAVETVLERMRQPLNGCLPSIRHALNRLAIVHFISISVVASSELDDLGALLVLEAAADGEPAAALGAIAAALREHLQALLRAADIAEQAPDLSSYLIEHECDLGQSWDSGTLGLPFVGTPGLSVRRIWREARLALRIAGMRDLLESDKDALTKLERVRAALWKRGDLKWAFVAEEAPHLDYLAQSTGGALIRTLPPVLGTLLWPALIVLLFLTTWSFWFVPAALMVAVGVVIQLRCLERSNKPSDKPADAETVHDVMERENLTPQNLLITVSTMQPGWVRRFALRIAFVIIGQMAAREFRPGFLADLGTIHFARWMLLPGGRKLVFFSHYDGSLESYLEDFIQEAHEGMTAIWSNAVGFPRTRWLFLDGAEDGDRLRRYVLHQQCRVRFCYSAYPLLSASRIRANAKICRGIAAASTFDEAEEWLACFGASGRLLPSKRAARPRAIIPNALESLMPGPPRAPLAPLEIDCIPTLLFGARKHLTHAGVLLIRFGNNPGAARKWLANVQHQVTYGRDRKQTEVLVLALAAGAFAPPHLSLATEELASFAPAFLNGMSSPARARALGDVGDNAPDHWAWGGLQRVDAALILYDELFDGLVTRVQTALEQLRRHRHTLVDVIPLLGPRNGGMAEPFGFTDGISQPKIRGIHDGEGSAGTALLEPGEFVLGYRDTRGYLPLSPSMATYRDRTGNLTRLEGGQCDLGRNGSYFVIRQLEQDVEGFHAWRTQTAAAVCRGTSILASVPPCLAADLIGAKLVGRWQNGSALAQHTASPGTSVRNDYLFGSVDASGLGCPLGAHTRRANPRDSFDPGSDRQLALTNRHRILRVGRPYKPEPGQLPGLMFMALNADIGRQFEFVQQTWLLGRNFHGLDGEIDPLLRSGSRKRATFTVHTSQGPLRLPLRQSFVRVRGGEYFFMPGRKALAALIAAQPA